uniref:DNA-(apurinic or apyrimidinic site) lyase (inferred by orthology to a human protein) n=1 Tax=Anisakis simplex TaxID=6269 RepID=A0A0M3JL45_ANISI
LILAEYEKFYLINAYVPNSGRGLVNLAKRKVWDKFFLDYIRELDAVKPIIYTGDLNVAHQEIDLANPKTNRNKTAGFTDQERGDFTRLLDAGMIDSH